MSSSTTPAGTQSYTTDLTDELISLTLDDGSTVGFTHDVLGNRTSRTVDGSLEATWSWDEMSSLPMRVGEYDPAGNFTTAWLPDPTSATGASLVETSGSASAWLLSDPFANTVASVSTTGSTLSGTRMMDAFGVQRSASTGGLADSAVGFAGQYLDPATEMYDMRARDYDPTSGRFTATDPVAVPTGMPFVAGYSYALNNPLMFTDPSGLTACGPIGSDCNGANLIPVFRQLARADNDTAYLNLYHSLTQEQASEIPFSELEHISAEAANRRMHQISCEDNPEGCWAPCPEQDYQSCQLKRAALGFTVYFAAPMVVGTGMSALLARACAADAAAAATRITAASTAPRFVAAAEGTIIDTQAPALAQQIENVVTSLRTTGRPPAGVRQGKAPGAPRGEFQNSQGRLPQQAPGYYTESDVWPGVGPRGTERIVIGGNGEAWYSPDHYGTFRSWPW
ncbi:RHS repeat-associated core domain-containing protein [Demequina sp.]|uniref:RHS repeat-associated core domain-containing protein n=1 Tax=Demequina sp. TaxID=2050685 RepID=UPI0025BCA1DA|nr:RHS repeat-associated core domain-containing protein [Demequina sp.]